MNDTCITLNQLRGLAQSAPISRVCGLTSGARLSLKSRKDSYLIGTYLLVSTWNGGALALRVDGLSEFGSAAERTAAARIYLAGSQRRSRSLAITTSRASIWEHGGGVSRRTRTRTSYGMLAVWRRCFVRSSDATRSCQWLRPRPAKVVGRASRWSA
ncbi:hypothetical protein OH77DRAFT_241863 [Trametes cingulata]|nr:hypothetical protein OH77DRAFT_241863 [Trametes cingulata]